MARSVELESAPRRRRRREDSEQEILEAAERLLRERPFRELTVDDLMAATTQSRTAFYRHFTGRQDLLIRLLSDLNQELWEVSQGWFQGSGDGVVARLERDAAAGRASVRHPDEVAAALVWMTERQLAVAFGRQETGAAERAATVEALYTIWTRALYGADPGD